MFLRSNQLGFTPALFTPATSECPNLYNTAYGLAQSTWAIQSLSSDEGGGTRGYEISFLGRTISSWNFYIAWLGDG